MFPRNRYQIRKKLKGFKTVFVEMLNLLALYIRKHRYFAVVVFSGNPRGMFVACKLTQHEACIG